MIGTWRWNAIAGAAVSLFIFLLSFSKNPLTTTLYRTCISFAVAFAVTYAVRWLVGQALAGAGPKEEDSRPSEDEGKGQAIDMVTPADPGVDDAFVPLRPPRLVTKNDPVRAEIDDPKRVADAVRHLTNQD